MFIYLDKNPKQTVTVHIEGAAVKVPINSTVAAAVLAHNIGHTRTTPISDSPRAPLCLMGVCFDCLMVIDGQANRQACMETVREGMSIERQQGVGA